MPLLPPALRLTGGARAPQVFGVEWAAAHLIPEVLSTHTHPNYMYRMTALATISSLASVVGQEMLCATMLPIVLRMGSDPVPNIRFNACKTLQALLPLAAAACCTA